MTAILPPLIDRFGCAGQCGQPPHGPDDDADWFDGPDDRPPPRAPKWIAWAIIVALVLLTVFTLGMKLGS